MGGVRHGQAPFAPPLAMPPVMRDLLLQQQQQRVQLVQQEEAGHRGTDSSTALMHMQPAHSPAQPEHRREREAGGMNVFWGMYEYDGQYKWQRGCEEHLTSVHCLLHNEVHGAFNRCSRRCCADLCMHAW